ncbi:MAG TPA: methyltransferase domain-containing protein [bacterium]|jgi:glycine/sarcosine N-methyltransferase|nr:methyltransferase domain-containing protein [bacterium]
MEAVKKTYDSLASGYHQMFGDWHASVRQQGRTLDGLLKKMGHAAGGASILDCSCGIGTQAIGLALLGHRVHATDLSPKAVQVAKRHAREMGAKLGFGVADFLALQKQVAGRFDVVLSCDNAIPHLLTEAAVLKAVRNMKAKLNPGGTLLLSIKDYEQVVPGWTLGAGPFTVREGKRLKVQVQAWEWRKKAPIYRFHLFLLDQGAKGWSVKSVSSELRAWKQAELSALLRQAGFKSVRWLATKHSGYRQPILTAKA